MNLIFLMNFSKNFLNVDIYYKELSVEEIWHQPAFQFLSLLSEIGGFLGLLLGASVLTICEVLGFIVITVSTAWSARRRPNHTDAIAPTIDKKVPLH